MGRPSENNRRRRFGPFNGTAIVSVSTEIGPGFTTLHHAQTELLKQVLTVIVLLVRESTSAIADAEARWLYAGLMGGIGSVCRSWRRLAKGVLMGDELAWLRVQGAAEAAECLSSFPHAKSLRIVDDAAAGETVSALRSGSVARLAITNNNVVRDCEGLDQLVGLRALYNTECRKLPVRDVRALSALVSLNTLHRRALDIGSVVHHLALYQSVGDRSMAPRLLRMPQLTSLDLTGMLLASAAAAL